MKEFTIWQSGLIKNVINFAIIGLLRMVALKAPAWNCSKVQCATMMTVRMSGRFLTCVGAGWWEPRGSQRIETMDVECEDSVGWTPRGPARAATGICQCV
ncbi:hypothetical protein [Methylomonas sp. CM2]|uniref:hypothetical protein n=1 Tax=Methylomonas sp. CM2 TaxID=3417647 RepID=UPI003CF788FC